ncbi:MAG TPA: AMP-binding protein [Acidimicrobiales bacterium]|nr:AMP-binding protein [Acidimicrobiales bacterium]
MTGQPAPSVQAAVREAAATFGSRPAVGFAGSLQSFAETYERSLRLAGGLEALGYGPGSRIGILATNGPWFFELYFAVCETGMVELPLNLRFTPDELVAYLGHVRPEVLVVTAAQAGLARELQARVPGIRHLIGIGDGHGLEHDYERLLASVSPYERALRDPHELALVCATSGTSGHPKAVMHTQSTTAAGYRPMIDRFDFNEDSHFVTGLAMYFAPAYSGWTMSFIAGAQHTIMPAYDPVGYVELVEETGGTHAFLGPTPVYLIMDSGVDLRRLTGVRHLSMGGAPCDPGRLAALTAVLGERVVIQFGMTELGAGTSLIGPEYVAPGGELLPTHRSIGRPFDGLEVRIVDDDGVAMAHDGESAGELQLAGPVVTSGYLDNPYATQAAFDDGWFRTGDIASIDAMGNVFILDRKKDLIVSGGINVAPLEVERAITAHPGVLAAGVCGVPDPTYGEAIHAAVVRAPGATVTEGEIATWCAERLASVKKPRSIAFVAELPISSTGKLLRRELRRQFAASG